MVPDIGLQDPVFLKRLKEAGIDPKANPKEAGAKWIDENIWHGRAHTWEKVKWTMEQWKRISGGRPFCPKGIQSVEAAQKCVEMYVATLVILKLEFADHKCRGIDGIVVTNHAGRQVDGAIASLDALEKIADAVGDKLYVSRNLPPFFPGT